METSEEIKKGLRNAKHVQCMGICDADGNNDTHYGVLVGYILRDRIYIYITELESRLAQVEKERDAAVRDMRKAVKENAVCIACKHDRPFDNNCEENDFDCVNCESPCMCKSCHNGSNYEWRGPCPENTPDPAKE